MDIATLSDAVYEVVQHSYTLSYRNENRQSPRSSLPIYYKIDVERKRTEAWANEVRSINIKNLRETFLPGEYNHILDALKELLRNYQQASNKLESVDHKKKTLLDPDLLSKDYDDLEKLLSNLNAANNALQKTAHPPPMYPTRSRKRSSRRQQELTHESKAADAILNQESIRLSFIPPVRTIYRSTISALITISVIRSDPKITRSASRLKLWGAGLFEMAVPLDRVFDSDKDAFRPVRQCILRILVDILVWAEQELNKLSTDDQNTEQLRDSQSAEEITALLGTDELIPLALESWKDRVDQLEYVQDGHVINTNYNPVPGLVEILFDLLPALRAMRGTYCSRIVENETLEENMNNLLPHQPAAITAQSISGEKPVFDEASVDLVNLKFDQANEILKKLDKTAKKNGAYTLRLRSEKKSIDNFHLDRRSRKGLDAKDLEAISEKQVQLDKNLTEFIASSSDKTNPSVRLGFLKKRQGKYVEEDVPRAESFLSSLTDTKRAMRNIMHNKGQSMERSKP